jgi:AraC family transcriptional regulator
MKRKSTIDSHQEKLNDALNLIYSNLGEPLHVKDIAAHVSTSPYHFNRMFHSMMGEYLHTYVKRVRLEFAANSLLFNPHSTVRDIAMQVGFESLSSFTHAFKKHFNATPGKWREVDKKQRDDFDSVALNVKPSLVRFAPRNLAYVRHVGYDKSIKTPWLKLLEWARYSELGEGATMIGIHHSNPRFVPRDRCHYVACLELDKPYFPKGEVGITRLPRLLCAVFSFEGQYGDLLGQMDSVYKEWLPYSGFESVPLPSFVIYHQNHFIDPSETYKLDFCVPVKYR